ncbi:alpha/beta hydrolase [Hyphomicrobiaceae bacterium 22]|uniref:Alpha/beta hydrolase n=2 Tax=Prosthecodimorpha staleyi TaxID=2840188 RepID=A0A947GF28_9HYPH|nr:alpha/beta hydrolase [Prosthecodimorpha staleyi]
MGGQQCDVLGTPYRPFRYFSMDGLALAGRDYRADGQNGPPLLCLPGLTRNGRDFEPVAARFAASRRVISLDLRGRGASEPSPGGRGYDPATEAGDVIRAMDGLGIDRAVFLGTSRGGIVSMVAAAMGPDRIVAAILNDIGARIEIDGLIRIRSYLAGATVPGDWPAAGEAAKAAVGATFPDLDAAAWDRFARRLWRDRNGRPALDYDPDIARSLDALTPDMPPIDLTGAFAALGAKPVMVIRGEFSTILSAGTVDDMAGLHPGLIAHTVPRQGHAPLLEDDPTLDAITAFLGTLPA